MAILNGAKLNLFELFKREGIEINEINLEK